MDISFDDYVSIMKSGNIRPVMQIEFLRSDGSIISSFSEQLVDGSLSISNVNGLRRSVTLTLQNAEKEFIPNIDGLWINSFFKLSLGIKTGDGNNVNSILFPQGVFCISKSEPEITSNFSEKLCNLKGDDKFALLDTEIGFTYQIPIGADVKQVIQSILNIVGDLMPPMIQDITDTSPYEMNYEESKTYKDIILDLASLYSREVFYDENGHFVFQELKDSSILGSEWDFTTEEMQYQGLSRVYMNDKVVNFVKVSGTNINGNSVWATSENLDLSSNLRTQLIGRKPLIINDTNIYTTDLCQKRADYELSKNMRLQDSVSLKSIILYHLRENQVITITDDSVDLDGERYQIQSMTVPLNLQSQITLTLAKANETIIN